MGNIWYSKYKTMYGSRRIEKVTVIMPQTENELFNEILLFCQFDMEVSAFDVYIQPKEEGEVFRLVGELYEGSMSPLRDGFVLKNQNVSVFEEDKYIRVLEYYELEESEDRLFSGIKELFEKVKKEFNMQSNQIYEVYLKKEEEEEVRKSNSFS